MAFQYRVNQDRIKFTYDWNEAALGGFAPSGTSRLELRNGVRDGRGCKQSKMHKPSLSIQSQREHVRGVQSRSATPRTSVEQHTGLGKVDEWQRTPLPSPSPPELGRARTTATLARIEAMVKNCISMIRVNLGSEWTSECDFFWEML